MPAENTAQLAVGRLLEIRAAAGYKCADDVDRLFAKVGAAVQQLPPRTQHVTVVDWRLCPIMAPEAAERIVQLISGTNDATLRSAALAQNNSPVTVMQFLRVIRDAHHPDRKLFFEVSKLESWLADVLGPEERTRLAAFLAEVDVP